MSTWTFIDDPAFCFIENRSYLATPRANFAQHLYYISRLHHCSIFQFSFAHILRFLWASELFEKTFVIHEYGLELRRLEAPSLKADDIFTNPSSNKTLFFSRCKMRLVKMSLDEMRDRKNAQSVSSYATSNEPSRISTAWSSARSIVAGLG
jgi:hypothetical protein